MCEWCEIELHVRGDAQMVDAFFSRVKGKKTIFDFNRLISCPEGEAPPEQGSIDEKEVQRKHATWRKANWGTPCEPDAAIVIKNQKVSNLKITIINFSTRYAPPFPVIEEAAKLFPQLRFELRYIEDFDGARGIGVFENGTLTDFKNFEPWNPYGL